MRTYDAARAMVNDANVSNLGSRVQSAAVITYLILSSQIIIFRDCGRKNTRKSKLTIRYAIIRANPEVYDTNIQCCPGVYLDPWPLGKLMTAVWAPELMS